MLDEEAQAGPEAAEETFTYERRKRKENPVQSLSVSLYPLIWNLRKKSSSRNLCPKMPNASLSPATVNGWMIPVMPHDRPGGHAKGLSPGTYSSGETVHKGRNRSISQRRDLSDSARF
jgi:hypothetical protein